MKDLEPSEVLPEDGGVGEDGAGYVYAALFPFALSSGHPWSTLRAVALLRSHDRGRRPWDRCSSSRWRVRSLLRCMLDALSISPALPSFGFVLVLIPLPWYLWNSGTCFYVIWDALACLDNFINSVVSANRCGAIYHNGLVGGHPRRWCISRHLYQIASVKAVSISNKCSATLIDSLICVLFPLVYVGMRAFIPQIYLYLSHLTSSNALTEYIMCIQPYPLPPRSHAL
ncbi:hypothetical protein K438DRAFT_1988384 [Mycena galopus ATCC 62051]|nr:hypothetical protein K438DRAFT_1988384 [Mycena galopus ATCC 62051]